WVGWISILASLSVAHEFQEGTDPTAPPRSETARRRARTRPSSLLRRARLRRWRGGRGTRPLLGLHRRGAGGRSSLGRRRPRRRRRWRRLPWRLSGRRGPLRRRRRWRRLLWRLSGRRGPLRRRRRWRRLPWRLGG